MHRYITIHITGHQDVREVRLGNLASQDLAIVPRMCGSFAEICGDCNCPL